jgi:hypothetical protein
MLWPTYGVVVGQQPMAILNAVCLMTSGDILLLKLCLDRYSPRHLRILSHIEALY